MKTKQFLLTLLLLLGGASLLQAQQASSVTQPTGDTWVRSDNASTNYGSSNTVEMQNNTNGTTDFYGVMQFTFDTPQTGYRIKSATLRLTTRFKKGDSKVNVYGLDAEVADNSNYGGLETAITTALETSPIASFNAKGYAQWAPTDGAVVNQDGGASYRVISAWQNNIDLTSYVQGLSTNTFAILLEKEYSQNNSTQFFSKEATDIKLNDESATFAATELVPQLTVTYEKYKAKVTENETITYCETLNAAFDAITTSGIIELGDDITLTNRCNTYTKNITVIPVVDNITISGSITNNIWILNNQSSGKLTIGSDTYAMTIDGGNYSVNYAHLAAEHGTTTIKNVTFKNCKGASDNGVVHLKSQNSSATLNLDNVTFDGCTANTGRGVVTVGTNNLYLKNAITFTDCSEGSYNFYLQNKFLRVGDLSTTQVAPLTLYYQNAALGNIILSSSTGENRSDLFKLMNEGYGIVKTADHWTDHFITEAYDLTVSDAKAATLVLPYEAKIPTGVKAYTLNYTAGNSSVKATEVGTNIPKNTPVLLNAEAGTYKFTNVAKVTEATVGAGTVTSGALTGVYSETVVPSGSYILYNKDENVGFYKVDGSTNKVAANRAYLTADGAGVRALTIDFSGEETGVNAIGNGQLTMDNAIYDLSGRRVSRPTKGLYIMNGKKVVLK